MNSRFKKDLTLQIYLPKAFFSDDQFLESVHKSFLNQTTLDIQIAYIRICGIITNFHVYFTLN